MNEDSALCYTSEAEAAAEEYEKVPESEFCKLKTAFGYPSSTLSVGVNANLLTCRHFWCNTKKNLEVMIQMFDFYISLCKSNH